MAQPASHDSEKVTFDKIRYIKANRSSVVVRGVCGTGYKMRLADWEVFKNQVDDCIRHALNKKRPATISGLSGVPK